MIGIEVFSYGGCGTNYLRRLVKSGTRDNILSFPIEERRIGIRSRVHQRQPPTGGYNLAIYVYGHPIKSIDSMLFSNQFRTMSILAGDMSLLVRQRSSALGGKENYIKYFENKSNLLNLEEHYDNWRNVSRPYDIMYVNYDALTNETFEQLCEALENYGVQLNNHVKNNFRPRTRNVRPYMKNILSDLNQTHQSLMQKISQTPPFELKKAN